MGTDILRSGVDCIKSVLPRHSAFKFRLRIWQYLEQAATLPSSASGDADMLRIYSYKS